MVAEPAFTSTSEDWLFLRILRRWIYNTGLVCYIPSLFVYYCFYLLFSEDLTVVRIYTIKIYWKTNNDISFSRGFLYVSVTWRFLLLYFFSEVSIIFLTLILVVVFFIVSFSWIYYLEFVSSFIPWLLVSLLWAFS